jgi:competence protein ComEA
MRPRASTGSAGRPAESGRRPSVVAMPRHDPHPGAGRLAAVLEPRPGAGPAPPRARPVAESPGPSGSGPSGDTSADDAPTVPLPVAAAPGRGRGRLAAGVDRWLPRAWRGARFDPGRPGALALLLTATVAAVLAAVGVWRQAPRAEPVPDLPALVDTATTAPSASPPTTPGPAEPLVVAVAGKVARPGLVQVPAGARVADVLAAAGGALPGTDLAGVNLARRVSDGEQVAVGVPAAPDAAPGSVPPQADPSAAVAAAPLDLNAATVAQLDALPGVGPVTAQRIVEWRTRNGRFATVDQLREVDGIGERRFGQLRALVRV